MKHCKEFGKNFNQRQVTGIVEHSYDGMKCSYNSKDILK